MGADFTASIRYNPEAKSPKPAYTIACRQLGISESGSGDLAEMVQTITNKIREQIAEEFRTMPRSVSLIGYGMTLRFEVIGPVNRSLYEFPSAYGAMVVMGDGTKIPLDQLTKTAEKVLDYARRTGKTPEQVLEEAKARLDREKKAAKSAKGAKGP